MHLDVQTFWLVTLLPQTNVSRVHTGECQCVIIVLYEIKDAIECHDTPHEDTVQITSCAFDTARLLEAQRVE